MPKRWCIDCRRLFDMDATGTLRCPACQQPVTAQRNARPSSSARGLGWAFSRRKQDDENYQQATRCQCRGCPRCGDGCGEKFSASNPKTGGHTIARSRGGGASRILPVCRSCNSSDGSTLRRKRG